MLFLTGIVKNSQGIIARQSANLRYYRNSISPGIVRDNNGA